MPLLLVAPLAACDPPDFLSYPPQIRGNKIDPDQIKELVPGTSTRQDVTALIGSPTAKATFDDNTWLYICEVTKPVIGGTQAVEEQQVYVLSFDQSGVLRGIQKKTGADSMPVDVVSRTTPSPGSEASFMQQLLGNVGKFNAAGTSQTGKQGGATNPGNF
jgi:outer membrane protein assembly factor BamE (lipoprotein component of BamABCDE complex)